jgi:hypothetical protein
MYLLKVIYASAYSQEASSSLVIVKDKTNDNEPSGNATAPIA